MDKHCLRFEEHLSDWIEGQLDPQTTLFMEQHAKACVSCANLRDMMDQTIYLAPSLQEDVPFFLKNRLYNIPENQHADAAEDTPSKMLRLAAAMVGISVLLLHLFYFTNLVPAGNRIVHRLFSGLGNMVVNVSALLETSSDGQDPTMYLFANQSPQKAAEVPSQGEQP